MSVFTSVHQFLGWPNLYYIAVENQKQKIKIGIKLSLVERKKTDTYSSVASNWDIHKIPLYISYTAKSL